MCGRLGTARGEALQTQSEEERSEVRTGENVSEVVGERKSETPEQASYKDLRPRPRPSMGYVNLLPKPSGSSPERQNQSTTCVYRQMSRVTRHFLWRSRRPAGEVEHQMCNLQFVNHKRKIKTLDSSQKLMIRRLLTVYVYF